MRLFMKSLGKKEEWGIKHILSIDLSNAILKGNTLK